MKFNEIINEELTRSQIKSVLTPEVRSLGRIFKRNGFELRIVGGAVRDLLLGKMPKDIDFATDATPDEMISFLEEEGWRTIPTGIDHGTISVLGEHDEPYEITTLRIDTEHTGRHATVEFTRDFEKDAERRDLTINAMSIDMDGKVYDYFGGVDDLRNHIARFVGNPEQRIQEDYLRILRYFRFQGRMKNVKFDPETENAIKKNAGGLEQISGERIWSEMQKILLGNHVEALLNKMCELGVAENIGLPCSNTKGIDFVSKSASDPASVMGYLVSNELQSDYIVNNWKLSTKSRELMEFVLNNKFSNITEEEAKYYLVSIKSPEQKFHLFELLATQGNDKTLKSIQDWKVPEFPVTGKDLISLGFKPGPNFGEVLDKLKTQWMNSGFSLSKEELLSQLGD